MQNHILPEEPKILIVDDMEVNVLLLKKCCPCRATNILNR